MSCFFICRISCFLSFFLSFKHFFLCICGAGRDSVSCQRWKCPDMGLDPGCLPIGHPASLHGVITRAGCQAAPAVYVLSAKGYQWGLIKLDGGADGLQNKCLVRFCLQNHWLTQYDSQMTYWLLRCQRKHLEEENKEIQHLSVSWSDYWSPGGFPFWITNILHPPV